MELATVPTGAYALSNTLGMYHVLFGYEAGRALCTSNGIEFLGGLFELVGCWQICMDSKGDLCCVLGFVV